MKVSIEWKYIDEDDGLFFLAIDLISHQLLQVNAGHRLAAANALRHTFFEVQYSTKIFFRRVFVSFIGLSIVL